MQNKNECSSQCGQCPDFQIIDGFDHLNQKNEDIDSSARLLENPQTDTKLRSRLKEFIETTDVNLVYGTVPRKCSPFSGPIPSNRTCIIK